MSTNCPNQIFKSPKLNQYSPIQFKRSFASSQVSNSKKKESQKSFNESPIDPPTYQHFYSNVHDDTLKEQEHNYFTASFQNIVGTYQTQQEDQPLRQQQNKQKCIQIQDQFVDEDCSVLEENSTIHQTQDLSSNQKINNSINPRLLHSKNSHNYPMQSILSSKDFHDSLNSSHIQEQKLISQIKQLDEAHELSKSFLSIQRQLKETFNNEKKQNSMQYDPDDSVNSYQKTNQCLKPIYGNRERSTSTSRKLEERQFYDTNASKSKTPRFSRPKQLKSPDFEFADQITDESQRNLFHPSISSKLKNFDTSKVSSCSNKHSQLLSISQGFFIQQNDKYMGTLNDFVDTKVNTLNYMILEKRRLQQLKEEKIKQLNKIQNDTSSLMKQQQLNFQELDMNFDKQNSTLQQMEDIKLNIATLKERVIEKREDYELQNYTLSKQIKENKQNILNIQDEIMQIKMYREKMRDQRQLEMNETNNRIKKAEQKQVEVKKKIDMMQINEKNRINYLQEKGCSIMKILQEDQLFQDKTNIKGQTKKNERTPNHRFRKLDLTDYRQYTTRGDRSTSANKGKNSGQLYSVRNKKPTNLLPKSKENSQSRVIKNTSSNEDLVITEQKRTQQCISYLSNNQGGGASGFSSKIQSCDLSESSAYDHVVHLEKPFGESSQPSFANLQQNKNSKNVVKSNLDKKLNQTKKQKDDKSTQNKSNKIVAKVNLF